MVKTPNLYLCVNINLVPIEDLNQYMAHKRNNADVYVYSFRTGHFSTNNISTMFHIYNSVYVDTYEEFNTFIEAGQLADITELVKTHGIQTRFQHNGHDEFVLRAVETV